MSEEEYIDAMNLSFVKSALVAVRALNVDEKVISRLELREMVDKLVSWETALHNKIKITE